jgi:hypothetical protein
LAVPNQTSSFAGGYWLCACKFRLDFVDVKINCTGGDPAELCLGPTVNYLSVAMPFERGDAGPVRCDEQFGALGVDIP